MSTALFWSCALCHVAFRTPVMAETGAGALCPPCGRRMVEALHSQGYMSDEEYGRWVRETKQEGLK